ncbi:MAG: alpha/beta hydrolase [Anaerolineae bacterium]
MGLGRYILKAASLAAGPAGWPPPLPPLAECDSGVAQRLLTLELRGGQTTATIYWPTGAPQGVAILLHAGGADRRSVWPWAKALGGVGLVSLAPDLDGHGSNTRPYTTVTRAAEVALAAVEAARSLDAPPFTILLGGSLGGVVALRAAELCATPTTLGSAPGIDALALLATPYASPFWQMLSPHLFRSAWEGQQIVGQPIRRDGPRPRFAALRDSLAREGLLESARAISSRPLLLVHGQYDPFAPPRHGEAYRHAHGSASLTVVPSAHAGALYGDEAVAQTAKWLAAQFPTLQ